MKGLTKIMATLGVGALLFLLLVFFLVLPMLSEVNAINLEVRAKKSELVLLQKQIRAFKNAQSDLAKATRKDDLLNAIPIKEDLVASVLDLEQAAIKSNSTQVLQMVDVGPKDKKPTAVIGKKTGIDEAQYGIEVKGDFAGVVNYLSYLEHLPHFSEISELALTSEVVGATTNTSGRTGTVNASLKGVFFIKIK